MKTGLVKIKPRWIMGVNHIWTISQKCNILYESNTKAPLTSKKFMTVTVKPDALRVTNLLTHPIVETRIRVAASIDTTMLFRVEFISTLQEYNKLLT